MGGTGALGRKLGKIIKLIFTIPLTDTDGRVHWLAEKSINAGLALLGQREKKGKNSRKNKEKQSSTGKH